MWRDILLIDSFLDTEDPWMEESHDWVLVAKSVGLRGSRFVLTNLSLMVLPADTLKASYDSTIYWNFG